MDDESTDPIDADLTYDDVDDVIEIAARKKQAAADRLSLEDLQEVADELAIAPEHVEDAVRELERRREEQDQLEEQRRQLFRKAAIAVGAVVLVVAGLMVYGQSRLRGDLNEARQQQSQVANVVDRHRTTEEYFADRDDSADRSAELQGALNRVSVETRRYDEAATEYNARARSFPSSIWVRLFGFPDELPMSDEIDEW